MKKKVLLAMVLSMSMALTACSSSSSSTSSSTDEGETTEEAEEETEEAEETGEVAVMTYAEYIEAETDAEVVIEAWVQAKQTWSEDTVSVYAQDEDGAYFIYAMACTEDEYELLEQGVKIRVTGYKSEWCGEVEITDATFEVLEDEESYIAEALDVTDLLADDTLIDYQNQFVSFSGMTVEAATDEDGNVITDDDGNEAAFLYNSDGSGEAGNNCDLYFNVSINGETYTFTVESSLCDEDSEVYQAVTALQVGDVIDMEGYLYWYEGVNPHITFVAAAENTVDETAEEDAAEETSEDAETESEDSAASTEG